MFWSEISTYKLISQNIHDALMQNITEEWALTEKEVGCKGQSDPVPL